MRHEKPMCLSSVGVSDCACQPPLACTPLSMRCRSINTPLRGPGSCTQRTSAWDSPRYRALDGILTAFRRPGLGLTHMWTVSIGRGRSAWQWNVLVRLEHSILRPSARCFGPPQSSWLPCGVYGISRMKITQGQATPYRLATDGYCEGFD